MNGCNRKMKTSMYNKTRFKAGFVMWRRERDSNP